MTHASEERRRAALPLIGKRIQRSEKAGKLPQKVATSAKTVLQSSKAHEVSYEDISQSIQVKIFFVPGPVKSFSKFFFSSLFIKIDAFKPTSKRFAALWQGSALRIFSLFFFFLCVIYPFKRYNKQHYAANPEPTNTKTNGKQVTR